MLSPLSLTGVTIDSASAKVFIQIKNLCKRFAALDAPNYEKDQRV